MKIGSYGHTANAGKKADAKWLIYHNPKCSKSREALDILRMNNVDPQIVEYLEAPLKKTDLEYLLGLLKVEAKEMIRTKESVFASLNVDLSNTDQILDAIAEHPVLLERPIIVHNGRAVIARPAERVLELKS